MSKIYQAFKDNEAVIRRIVAKYRSRPEDVEDLTQETFLRSFAAEIKQDIHQPKHFLLRVAKNLALSDASRKVNSATDSIEDSGGIDVYKDRQQLSIEDQIDSRQKLLVFSEALAQLEPELRRSLIMRKIDGLKFAQIAMRLNVSKSTVEKRVALALVLCNTYLRDNGYDPADFGAVGKAHKRVQAKVDADHLHTDGTGQ